MKAIYKYPISVTDHQNVMLPPGARIIKVAFQYIDDMQQLNLWAIVDPTAVIGTEITEVWIYGTGHMHNEFEGEYFDTVFDSDGYVWHVFLKHVGIG